jgi:hypothetical protein
LDQKETGKYIHIPYGNTGMKDVLEGVEGLVAVQTHLVRCWKSLGHTKNFTFFWASSWSTSSSPRPISAISGWSFNLFSSSALATEIL